MSVLTAQIHIDASSSCSHPLPPSPLPLDSSSLSPSTELRLPLPTNPSSSNSYSYSKPQTLSHLADAIDTTRANLNQILTCWKEWAGKELPSNNHARLNSQNELEDDEQDDQDDE